MNLFTLMSHSLEKKMQNGLVFRKSQMCRTPGGDAKRCTDSELLYEKSNAASYIGFLF